MTARRALPPALQAALWVISSGRCYAPGCPSPVVVEVRPGYYEKNAQLAHIYGVRPGAARYRPEMTVEERDSFRNLLLLCMAHHGAVDNKRTGEAYYPPELLHKWKVQHEGAYGSTLATIGQVSDDALMNAIVAIFEPPIQRLETIADQLEQTGTITASTVTELRQIVLNLTENSVGPDPRTVAHLADAVDALGGRNFATTVGKLQDAASAIRWAVQQANQHR